MMCIGKVIADSRESQYIRDETSVNYEGQKRLEIYEQGENFSD